MGPRSSEDSLRIRAQLRPTFARRRRDYYRKRNSGEKPVPRRKALVPVRVVLAGAGERPTLPPPTSPRSPEDSLRIRTQLRPSFARRRRDYYRKLNSGERGVRRRKAPNQKKGTEGPQITRFLTFIKQLYHPQSPTLPVSFPARVFLLLSFPSRPRCCPAASSGSRCSSQ